MSATSKPTIEVRFVSEVAPTLETRRGLATVIGLALPFGRRSLPLPGGPPGSGGRSGRTFLEEFDPRSLDRLQERRSVLALVHHDPARCVGNTRSGTLRLRVAPRGLEFELDLPESPEGENLRAAVARGDASGVSVGFIARRDEWITTERPPVRRVLDADVFEVSVGVGLPAFPETEAVIEQRAIAFVDRVLAEDGQRTRGAEIRALEQRVLALSVSTR